MNKNKEKNRETAKAKQLLDVYNLAVNLFWSALSLVPLTVFCYRFVGPALLVAFLTPAVLSLFLPACFFDQLLRGKTSSFYKRLGVGFVNLVSQNGVFVQRQVKKRFPEYRALTHRHSFINRLLHQTYLFEKFHFAAAIFFFVLAVYASSKTFIGWAVVLTTTNVFYNFYPMLLQHYIRLKLHSTQPKAALSTEASSMHCIWNTPLFKTLNS